MTRCWRRVCGYCLNAHYEAEGAIVYYGTLARSAARASYRSAWARRTARDAPTRGWDQDPPDAAYSARGRGVAELASFGRNRER